MVIRITQFKKIELSSFYHIMEQLSAGDQNCGTISLVLPEHKNKVFDA